MKNNLPTFKGNFIDDIKSNKYGVYFKGFNSQYKKEFLVKYDANSETLNIPDNVKNWKEFYYYILENDFFRYKNDIIIEIGCHNSLIT